jgi:hypothetical protein
VPTAHGGAGMRPVPPTSYFAFWEVVKPRSDESSRCELVKQASETVPNRSPTGIESFRCPPVERAETTAEPYSCAFDRPKVCQSRVPEEGGTTTRHALYYAARRPTRTRRLGAPSHCPGRAQGGRVPHRGAWVGLPLQPAGAPPQCAQDLPGSLRSGPSPHAQTLCVANGSNRCSTERLQ